MSAGKPDGGPAFPLPIAVGPNGQVFAAAEFTGPESHGMTVRDYFAAKAMQGQIGKDNDLDEDYWLAWVAKSSYSIADAMLKAREA